MSRIQEALKKGGEKRAGQATAGVEAGVAEIAAEPKGLVTLEPEMVRPTPSPRVTSSGKQDAGFRYEELVKRCAHQEWRLDPFNSVFLNSKRGEGGPERFRTLRSRLYKIASTRKLKRVLITSGVAAEGKTFVASNLAQSIIQQPELRVLLIDGDLRSSRLHLMFGAPNCPGPSEDLRADGAEYGVVQKAGKENLCLIP